MSSFTIRSNDPSVGAQLQGWLDRMQLPLPRALEIVVEVTEEIRSDVHPNVLFRQPEVSIHPHDASGGLSVSWDHAPAVAHLPHGADSATVFLSIAATQDLERCCRFFFSMLLILLVRRVGWHHLHAATWLDPSGRGWAFAGDWKVGKSTTTALLASCGWPVGGDDVIFLAESEDGVTTIARRGEIGLREGGMTLLGKRGGVFDASRRKSLFTPEELGGRWVQTIRPEVLLFPTIGEGTTSAEPIGASEVLAQLVRWSAWVILEPALAQGHLDLLASLGRQARSYRVTLGTDLFENPEILLDIVS
ncbi:MAG: hypothetical protein P8L45_10295 [Longimicrobiales bacterium]|nr:hypothetical protein [Longimicrobiales bacterium]